MPRNTWLSLLPLFLFCALIICLAFSFFVPVIISRQDDFGNAYAPAEKRNARLRFVCIGICAAALIGCGILQTNVHISISDIAQGKTFASFEEFKEYAETPLSVDYDGHLTEIYDEKTGEVIRYYELSDQDRWSDTYLPDAYGNKYAFTQRNLNICMVDYNEDLSRITVYSRADQIAYNHYVEMFESFFLLAYIAVISAAVIIYLKKRIRIGTIVDDVS